MKEVMVKITGYQTLAETGDQDMMEFITEAKMYKRGDAIYLLYEESEVSGIPGCRTRLKLKGDMVHLKRFGEGPSIGNEIRFEQGKRYTGYYDTPFGPLEMEVLTNALENTLSDEGEGQLNIDYHISLKGLMESRNKLNIILM